MRYVIRARRNPDRADFDDYWDNGSLRPDLHVGGPKEVDTGLVDAHGKSIYRVPPPIGFGRDGEW